MKTIEFNNVYIKSKAAVVGPIEAQGPLQKYFDKTFKDTYCGEKSFEKAERRMLYEACDCAIRKKNIRKEEIQLVIGGDLLNQLESSHYFGRDISSSFIGMYAACATSCLVIGNGAIYVDNYDIDNVLCFTSSHNACAERQFRYPNEYGIQKKETTTYTVSGAGCIILTKNKTPIKVKAYTIGKIVDWNFKDANNMGVAMAPAAYETIMSHLKNRNKTIDDYDLIVTGDLSKLGYSFLCSIFNEENININNKIYDCGLLIYDLKKQDVFCGGSGCACSMCVTISYLLDLLEKKKMNRILVVATGALLSTNALYQKESIPCIAHAIEYEGSDINDVL